MIENEVPDGENKPVRLHRPEGLLTHAEHFVLQRSQDPEKIADYAGDLSEVGHEAYLLASPLFELDDDRFLSLTPDEQSYLNDKRAAIVEVSHTGENTVRFFDSSESAMHEWARVVERLDPDDLPSYKPETVRPRL